MKLIIQIPCHNEAGTLPATVADLPRRLEGIDEIEYLVVDDGSSDQTAEIARSLGVHHVVRLTVQRGLAHAFASGLNAALDRGADIIVNTDADNQYRGEDIALLIAPILRGEADMVVGARPISEIDHFSRIKKALQWTGSWVVRKISRTAVPDAASGFRALSSETAFRLNVFSRYTYTLETIIQAGLSNIVVTSVPIRTNAPTRESRLIKNLPSYLCRSLLTMLRVFIVYKPLRFFVTLGGLLFAAGLLLGLRFVYYYFLGQGGGMVQSLILAAVLLLMGFQLGVFGVLADLISTNRRILEDLQYRERRRAYQERPAGK